MRQIIIGLLLLLSGCAATQPQTVWLDVRSAEEFASGHLPGAVNIPHTEVAQRINELKLDKDTNIALYCGSGRRAAIAIETLQQQGYTNLTNHGGYDTLKQKYVAADERQ